MDVLKKLRNMMDTRLSKVVQQIEDLTAKDKSFSINMGQLTTIAATPIGQSIGLNSLFSESEREIAQAMQKHFNVIGDLENSIMNNSLVQMPMHRHGNSTTSLPKHEAAPQGNKAYIEQVKMMEQKIQSLSQENEDLLRKFKKYYAYTKRHIEEIKEQDTSKIQPKNAGAPGVPSGANPG